MQRLRFMLSLVVLLIILTASPHPTTAQSKPFTLLSQAGRGTILNVMWRPNGDTILAATATGAWLYTADLHDLDHIDGLQLATYSPRGRYISGVDQDNVIRLYDADTLRPIFSLDTPRDQVHSLIWSPKGDLLAELDAKGDLRVWNIVSRSLAFTSRDNNFSSIAWSKAGTYLAASASKLWVWESTNFEQIFPMNNDVYSDSTYHNPLTWHGDRIVSVRIIGGDTEKVNTWDMLTRREINYEGDIPWLTDESTCYPIFAVCSPDYQSEVYLPEVRYEPTLIVTNHPRAALKEIRFEASTSSLAAWRMDSLSLAVSIISGTENEIGSGTILVMDITTGKATREINAHRGALRFLLWNDDQQRLLSVGEDGYLRTWQTASGVMLGETHAHSTITRITSWNFDQQRLASADAENSVYLWNANNLFAPKPLGNVGYNTIAALKWQPHGTLLAVHYARPLALGSYDRIDNGIIEIWDTEHDAPTLVTMFKYVEDVSDIAWNDDGDLLAIVSRCGLLEIWNPRTQHIDVQVDLPAKSRDSFDSYRLFPCGISWKPHSNLLAVYQMTSVYSSNYWLVQANGGTLLMFVDQLANEEDDPSSGESYGWTPSGLFIHAGWGTECLGGLCTWNGAIIEKVWPEDKFGLKMRVGRISNQFLEPDYGWFDSVYSLSPSGTLLLQNGTTARIDEYGELSLVRGISLWQLPLDTEEVATQHYTLPAKATALISWSTDSSMFVLDHEIIDVKTGRTITTLPSRRQPPTYIWSADSTHLAEISAGVLYIWER